MAEGYSETANSSYSPRVHNPQRHALSRRHDGPTILHWVPGPFLLLVLYHCLSCTIVLPCILFLAPKCCASVVWGLAPCWAVLLFWQQPCLPSFLLSSCLTPSSLGDGSTNQGSKQPASLISSINSPVTAAKCLVQGVPQGNLNESLCFKRWYMR